MIKVFGHIFLREHSKCMTQVPSSSVAALKISAAAPTSPAHVLGGEALLFTGWIANFKFLLHFSYKHNEFKPVFSFSYANNMAPRSEFSSKEKAKPSNIVRLEIKILIT